MNFQPALDSFRSDPCLSLQTEAPHTSLINWRVTLKTSSNYHIKEQHQFNLPPTFTHVPSLITVLSFIPVAEMTISHWYHWISFHLWSKHQVTKAFSTCPALEEFYDGLLFDECWPWQKASLTRGSERGIWVAAQKIDCTTVRLQIATVQSNPSKSTHFTYCYVQADVCGNVNVREGQHKCHHVLKQDFLAGLSASALPANNEHLFCVNRGWIVLA